jgi:hypothetical protein
MEAILLISVRIYKPKSILLRRGIRVKIKKLLKKIAPSPPFPSPPKWGRGRGEEEANRVIFMVRGWPSGHGKLV